MTRQSGRERKGKRVETHEEGGGANQTQVRDVRVTRRGEEGEKIPTVNSS